LREPVNPEYWEPVACRAVMLEAESCFLPAPRRTDRTLDIDMIGSAPTTIEGDRRTQRVVVAYVLYMDASI
jgi:hypothetical protein